MTYNVAVWGTYEQIPHRLLFEPCLLPLEKLVVMMILQFPHGQEAKDCYLAHASFIDDLGCSKSALQDAFEALEKMQIVVIEKLKGRRQTNRYFVRTPDQWQLDALDADLIAAGKKPRSKRAGRAAELRDTYKLANPRDALRTAVANTDTTAMLAQTIAEMQAEEVTISAPASIALSELRYPGGQTVEEFDALVEEGRAHMKAVRTQLDDDALAKGTTTPMLVAQLAQAGTKTYTSLKGDELPLRNLLSTAEKRLLAEELRLLKKKIRTDPEI